MVIDRGNIRRGVLGLLAAAVLVGVAIAIVVLPSAKAEPTTTPSPTPSPTDTTTTSPTATTTTSPTATTTTSPTTSPTAAPAAAADPCLASNLTETISKVNRDISDYLVKHPETNQALADAAKQSPFAAQSAFTSYFDGNPTAKADLHTLQQPLVDLSNQCGYQVTAGQVLGALSDL